MVTFKLLLSSTFLLHLTIANPKTDGERRLQQKSLIDSLRYRVIDKSTEKMSDEELVDYVNSKQQFWKAEKHNRFSSYSDHTKNGMMGVQNIHLPAETKRRLSSTRNLNITIPHSFDAREWWSDCHSIGKVGDQSSCGSCWAFSAAEAITDRICIASKAQIKKPVSVDDVLACCRHCGDGCDGGFPITAWDYWVLEGLVTGGDYGSNDTCLPYPFPSCSHGDHGDICKQGIFHTPQCSKRCQRSYHKNYYEDKHYGLSSYGVQNHPEAIQKELMTYGPVQVAFEVYADFFHYKQGVYMHTAGMLAGGHAVKLIGWGEENGLPYWLLVNSWNTDWGNNGYFKVLRGVDECGIESGVVAGIPKTY